MMGYVHPFSHLADEETEVQKGFDLAKVTCLFTQVLFMPIKHARNAGNTTDILTGTTWDAGVMTKTPQELEDLGSECLGKASLRRENAGQALCRGAAGNSKKAICG